MTYNFDISAITIILLCLTFLCALSAALFGLAPMRKVARAAKRLAEAEDVEDDKLPGLSVIVHALNDEAHVASFLKDLMAQDYPDYEVIVVNDASIDNTTEIVENFAKTHPAMKVTFVPESAINVSRRKTAYTLGLKGASKEVALITSSNVDVPSALWLRRMAAPFADSNIEVCIGMSHTSPDTDRNFGKLWRSFDSMTTLSQWLGTALKGNPYRGDRYNLAFRREIFFRNKGFASSNRFHAGEDDIFVNEISTPENTAVVIAGEARPEVLLPSDQFPRLWLRSKERYTFTSRYLHTNALLLQGFHSLMIWAAICFGASASAIGMPNIFPASVALLTVLLMWGDQICVYHRAAQFLNSRPLLMSVPFLWLLRPVLNGFYRLSFRRTRTTNYTWRHDKK